MKILIQSLKQRWIHTNYLKLVIIGLFLVMFGFIVVHSLKPVLGAVAKTQVVSNISAPISNSKPALFQINLETSRFILRNGISFLEPNLGQDKRFQILNFNWSGLYWRLAGSIPDTSPLSIVRSQLPVMALFKPKPFVPAFANSQSEMEKQPEPLHPDNSAVIPESSGEPTVFIYHTHTTESYIPESGKDHTPNSQGDIVKVGAHLQQILAANYGIMSLHCETVHDIYPFRDSYKRSQLSIRQYLTKYPNLQVVLDVHRDATPGVEARCVIHGQKMAKIRIVVGSDKMGLPHPNWRQNLRFAKVLENAMDLQFPSLCSGIVISDARYNQHLHSHALIIEFGDQNSTLSEVFQASECFAACLNWVLNPRLSSAFYRFSPKIISK